MPRDETAVEAELREAVMRRGFEAWYGKAGSFDEFAAEIEGMWGRVADAILPLINAREAALNAEHDALMEAASLEADTAVQAMLLADKFDQADRQLAESNELLTRGAADVEAATAEIAALRAERDAALLDVERAKAVLEPFAQAAKNYWYSHDLDNIAARPGWAGKDYVTARIIARDLRRARHLVAALKGAPEPNAPGLPDGSDGRARERALREAAAVCGSLAETDYADGDQFEAATGCEAAILSLIRHPAPPPAAEPSRGEDGR